MADVAAYDPVFEAAGNEWNVDPQLLKAMAIQESGGRANAVSKAGALGVMQIMPETAKTLGITDPTDPVQSIYGAAKYMNRALDKEGSVEDALRNYHGGDGWRQAYGPESAGYVPAVTKHYQILGQFKAALADPDPSVRTDATQAAASAPAASTGAGKATASDDPLSLLPPAPKPSGGGGAEAAAPDDPLSLLPPAPKPTGTAAAQPTPAATGLEGYPEEAAQADYAKSFPQPASRPAAPPAPLPAPGNALQIFPGGPTGGGLGDPGTLSGAVAEGWRNAPSFWTSPEARQGAANVPVVGPLYAAGGDLIGGALGIGNALLRGVQQTAGNIAEPIGQAVPVIGGPGLGRDVAALPEAFPTGDYGQPNALRPEAPSPQRPQFVSERMAPPRPLGMTDAERIQQLVEHGVNEEQPAIGPPMARGPATWEAAAGPSGPTEGGGPQPAGAQATPTSAARMTPEEIATQRTVADKEWLNQTQQPGVRDTTQHIPGITSNLVEQEQTVTAARELKALKNLNPELSQAEREILDRNTELRKGHFADTVGSDVTRAADLKAANDKINTDLARVWQGKGEADPANVHVQIATELAGSAGDLPPLKSAMKQVADSLENAGTDPQAMYRTHRLINYLQSKQGQLANPGYGAGDVQAALTRVKATLAKTIDDAAPGFGQAMSDYSGARGPIDAAKALQDRENGLYDTRGHMSFLKVHALMRDIIDAQKWDAPNDPLAGVSDAQMTRLKALHDDLKKVASAKDLATAQGSDTAMNAVDIAQAYGKLATRVGVEGAANVAFGPGVGSMIVRGAENLLRPITSGIATRGQIRRGMEILQPPPSNPLQQP